MTAPTATVVTTTTTSTVAATAAPVASASSAAHHAASSSSSSVPHPRVVIPIAQPVMKAGKEEMIDARLIMDLPQSRIYTLIAGSKHLTEDGKLEIYSSVLAGETIYMLILGKVKLALRVHVPCLEMAPRNFVFPTDGTTYGLVLHDAITDDVMDVFRLLLTDHTSFRSAAQPQPISALPDKPDKVVHVANSVAAGLGAGSIVVATGVIKGGRMVGSALLRGGEYLTSKLKPNDKVSIISDATKTKIARAKFVSGAACKVSKALVIGAVATTEMMSRQLSDAIKDTDIGRKISSDPEHPNQRLDAAKHVGKATIGALLNVYTAIETAVFGVAHDAASATVTVVTHKYGNDAGSSTKEGLSVVGNVASAAHSMKQVGVKSIVGKTVIKAGQNVLTTPQEAEEQRLAAAAASSSSSSSSAMGAAMGLPAGIDPLMALEAMQAASALSSAAAPYVGHHMAEGESVTITTAIAGGETAEIATANATAAAQQASKKH